MFLYYATVPKSYRATTNCHHSSSVELSSFIFPFLCFGFIFHVCRLFVRCSPLTQITIYLPTALFSSILDSINSYLRAAHSSFAA